MFTAANESLLRRISAVLAKLSLVARRGPSWNDHWRSHKGVKTFKDRRIRHDRIAVLRSRIQAGLKRSMEKHETLNLESLELEKKTRPPRQRRANEKKVRPGSSTNTDGESLPQVFEQTSARIREAAPTVSSSDSLPTNPLATLANPWNPVNGRRAVGHNGVQTASRPLKYQPGQDFVPVSHQANTTYYQPAPTRSALRGLSSILNDSSDPGPFVQKSKLHTKTSSKLVRSTPDDQQPDSQDASTTPPPRARSPIIEIPPPQPTPTYLTLANLPPTLLPTPQPLLLVLDLNGTLLHRNRAQPSRPPRPRPSLTPFLTYALTNHRVLIWSSAKPHNVSLMCSHLFTPQQRSLLLGEWARDTLGLTAAQYKDRVQVFKNLERVWNNSSLPQPSLPPPQAQAGKGGGRWGQHNTLLIDDSPLKASAQPYNHILIPEFVKGAEREGDGKDVFGKVVGYLEEARRWSDVSAFGRERRFSVEGGWGWVWEGRRGSAVGGKGGSGRGGEEQSTTASDYEDEDDEDEDSGGGVNV